MTSLELVHINSRKPNLFRKYTLLIPIMYFRSSSYYFWAEEQGKSLFTEKVNQEGSFISSSILRTEELLLVKEIKHQHLHTGYQWAQIHLTRHFSHMSLFIKNFRMFYSCKIIYLIYSIKTSYKSQPETVYREQMACCWISKLTYNQPAYCLPAWPAMHKHCRAFV